MNRIERPKTLVEMATEAIRTMIVEGRFELGQRLSENKIAESLGISTTPVREAFAALAHEGLVEIVPQRGTFVFELAPGELDHVCELRVALETAALRIAFARRREQLADQLAGITAAMERAVAGRQTARYLALDTGFHAALIGASGNPYLVDAYALIAAKLAALRFRLGSDPHHTRKSMAEHRAIADAVASGTLAEALRVLERQIGRKEGSYWEQLDESALSALATAGR